MKTYSTFAAATLLAASPLAQKASPPSVADPQTHRPIYSNSGGRTLLGAETKGLLQKAAEAEKRGEFELAKSLYRRASDLRPTSRSSRLFLAQFYDRTFRDRQAFVEYRAVVSDQPSSWSSSQEDPRVLARYGDLAARFGNAGEAETAYAKAARFSNCDEARSPNTVPRNDSFLSLKAAAHTSASIHYRNVGDDAAETRPLDIAVEADSGYWIARYYRACLLQRNHRTEEAIREAQLTLNLAPKGKPRKLVHQMRSRI